MEKIASGEGRRAADREDLPDATAEEPVFDHSAGARPHAGSSPGEPPGRNAGSSVDSDRALS